jgi:hypothetical protein
VLPYPLRKQTARNVSGAGRSCQTLAHTPTQAFVDVALVRLMVK